MYQKIQYRVDIVKRVPAWAERYGLKVGEKVIRTADDTVITERGNLALGRSYTKEWCWTLPQPVPGFQTCINLVKWYNK